MKSTDENSTQIRCEPGAAGIIMSFVNNGAMTRDRMVYEWVDNSLDAKARQIRITRNETHVEIRDDGIGCNEPRVILTPSRSRPHDSGARSGMFGMGGKIASMRASQGQRTDVESVHNGMLYRIEADWSAMVQADEWTMRQSGPVPARDGRRGTIIRNLGPKGPITFPGADRIAAKLAFDYADALEAGVSIALVIDGKRYDVCPYRLPRFVDKVEFEVEFDGHRVRGFCGLVHPDESNPRPGWTFHWGPHRVLMTTEDPADGKYCGRIQGHVYLPLNWSDVNVTKDDFGMLDPTELYTLIGNECRRIIDAAQEASEDYEIKTFTEQVNSLLNGTIIVAANGRRPGSAGKVGTVESKDTGREHKKFNVWKPGTRGTARTTPAIPQRIEVHWNDNIENSWEVSINGKRSRVAHITLNHARPIISSLREKKNAHGVFAFCTQALASYLGINRELQSCFGFSDLAEVHEIFDRLTGSGSQPAKKATA